MSVAIDDASDEAARLQAAIGLLQSQAGPLGPQVLALALGPLQQRLAALQAGQAPRLRQVSVLFVDIVESTRLLRQLDAEDSHGLLDHALQRFGELVGAHGGRVLRYTGDGLKAAFGMPEPSEDDAERAVRAGLAILAAARQEAEQARSGLGVAGFAVRAGVHTGPVAMGAGVEDTQTLVGATVHLAARMEQAAPAGGLRISRETRRLVRGAFELQAQPPLQVKGEDQPLLTYLVLRELARAERGTRRGVEGLDAGMVGREEELAELAQACASSQSTAVLVVGEAGLGKSRLRDALLGALRDQPPACLTASAWPQALDQPFALLRELMLEHLRGLRHPDPGKKELLHALEGLASPLEAAAFVDAIGLGGVGRPAAGQPGPDRGLLRQRAFDVATRWMRSLAAHTAGRPLRLLLDDLHWADEATLDLLDHWRTAHADLPLCVIAFSRPGGPEHRTGWARQVVLQPLDDTAGGELADRLLHRLDPVDDRLREALLQRAGGHPYYLEELLAMLIDQGDIDTAQPRWRWRGGLEALGRLPVTLSGVLQARLSQLSPAQRTALQQAAVIGPRFTGDLLAVMDPAAPDALPELEQRGLVHAGDEGEWRFHHHLLQQVAYDTLRKAERAAWHGHVAVHLATQPSARAHEVAVHFDRAGQPDAAAAHYTRAALEGDARLTADAQLHAAERALALAPDADAPLRWRLQWVGLRSSHELQRVDAIERHLAGMRALADQLDDDGLRAENEFQAVLLREGMMDPEQAAPVVALAERAAARGQPAPLARAHALLAWALCCHGRAAEGRRLAEQALTEAYAAGEIPPSQATTSAAIAAWKLGDLSAGLGHVLAGLDNDRARGNLSGEVAGLCNLAGMARTLGDLDCWRRAVDDGIRLAQAQGNRRAMPLLRVRRGQLLESLGELPAALAEIRGALALLPPDDGWYRITALMALGHVQLAAGESARGSFSAALAGAGNDAGMQAEALAGLVRVALAEQHPAEAAEHARALRRAMEAPEPGDITERPVQWLAVADALEAAGDATAAQCRAAARQELLAQAACIGDPAARERFLAEVPHNRRILARG